MVYYQNNTNAFISYNKPDKTVKESRQDKAPKKKDNAATGLKNSLSMKWGYKSQVELFEAVWDKALKEGNGKIICPFTNKDLTRYADGQMSFWVSCFLHILSKKQYPYYKLNPSNVIIANPTFHSIVDQGRLSDRAAHSEWKWDKWDKLVEQKKLEYTKWLKEHI